MLGDPFVRVPERAVDPVSGAEFSPGERPLRLHFRGALWLFESVETLRRFKRDPEAFADARPDAAVRVRPPAPAPARRDSPFNVTGGPRPQPETGTTRPSGEGTDADETGPD